MLILACQRLKSINAQVVPSPEDIHTIDLTANRLKSGDDFSRFPNLVHLILDKNGYSVIEDFPTLLKLETFSANKNEFENLDIFLEQLKKKFPKLKNLSLVGNPLCPYFEGGKAYAAYKAKVLHTFPNLETLDGGYVERQGVKLNVQPKKQSRANKSEVKENLNPQENIQLYKKDAEGYKIKEMNIDADEQDESNREVIKPQDEKKVVTVIEYSEKYTKQSMRNMKLRSQGNRYVSNDQL